MTRSVEPEAVHPDALRAEIRRAADRTAHGLRATAYRERPEAEALHRLHRDLRELRVAYGLLAEAYRPADRSGPADVDRRLRRLARLVGEVRDRDVGGQLVMRHRGDRDAIPASAVRRLRRRLDAEAHVGRDLLRAASRHELEQHLLRDLTRWAGTAPPPTAPRLAHALTRARDGLDERLRGRYERALLRASTRRLHAVRIALRNRRTLDQLLHHVVAGPLPSEPRELPKLQRALGQLHDLDLLAGRLATLPTSPAIVDWTLRLRGRRRRLRARLLRRLQARRVRRAFAGLREER